MNRFVSFAAGLLGTFGGLILYWIALLTFGVKPAIAVAIVYTLLDGSRRLVTGQALPPIWLAGNGAAILFGLIDLYARTPFMIRYEGAILNLGWAFAFAIGTFGKEPIVLRFARHRSPDIPETQQIIRFFRAFTFAWSVFFMIRAVTILWIMECYPLTQAIAIRTAFGWISMGGMLLVSFNGRRVYDICRSFGLFAPPQE